MCCIIIMLLLSSFVVVIVIIIVYYTIILLPKKKCCVCVLARVVWIVQKLEELTLEYIPTVQPMPICCTRVYNKSTL